MENLYIGSKFSREMVNQDGSAFSGAPYVVLHCKSTQEFVAADSVTDTSEESDKTVYTFVFNKTTTAKMKAGVYVLEIFKDDTKEEMLDCDTLYSAVESAAAPNQTEIDESGSASTSASESESVSASESESETSESE